jgi:small GTP-binding protein
MKTLVLIGDPNVGKSVLFSRLTGVDVIFSNYPGTTVDYAKGRISRHGETLEIIDAPGTYSLEPTNKAEEVAVSLLDKADVIVNVVDATSLERCLLLTVELLARHKPVVIALNMWDEAQHLGITINVRELESLLQIPVIPTVAITGEGVKELVLFCWAWPLTGSRGRSVWNCSSIFPPTGGPSCVPWQRRHGCASAGFWPRRCRFSFLAFWRPACWMHWESWRNSPPSQPHS